MGDSWFGGSTAERTKGGSGTAFKRRAGQADPLAMRTARVLVSALLLLLGSGCFVVDEIDQGMKVWKHHSPKKKKAVEAPPEGIAAAPSDPAANPDAWWRGARSLDSQELSPDIVSCALGGSTQFMREADCLSQGGTPR
jgi:hypothetical protein